MSLYRRIIQKGKIYNIMLLYWIKHTVMIKSRTKMCFLDFLFGWYYRSRMPKHITTVFREFKYQLYILYVEHSFTGKYITVKHNFTLYMRIAFTGSNFCLKALRSKCAFNFLFLNVLLAYSHQNMSPINMSIYITDILKLFIFSCVITRQTLYWSSANTCRCMKT